MCQMFNGISSGIWAITAHLAVMASVTHQEISVAVAMFSMFGSIGAAIGLAIAGSLWTNILPYELYKRLPANSKDLTAKIYGSIVIQKSYPMGSPIRYASIGAYADVQQEMVIPGAAFQPLLLICIKYQCQEAGGDQWKTGQGECMVGYCRTRAIRTNSMLLKWLETRLNMVNMLNVNC